MNRHLIAAALFIASATPAIAAPQAEPNTLFNGFYLGANAGYSWGRSNSSTYTTLVPENSYFFLSDIIQINNNGSAALNLNNFSGGIQAGYSYQPSHLLLGLEGDFDSLNGSSSNSRSVVYLSAPDTTFILYTKTQTSWLASLRPRIGYAVGHALFYVTGGLAFARLQTENRFSDNFLANTPAPSNAFESASHTQTKTGEIFGGGIEYSLTQHILIRAEYLYAKFGEISSSGALSLNPAYSGSFVPPLVNSNFNHSANFSNGIIRFGVNYRF